MTDSPTLIPELKVTNFQASLDFYTTLAGFELLYTRPEEDFAMLGLNGAQLMIEGISEKACTWATGEFEYPLGRGINLQI